MNCPVPVSAADSDSIVAFGGVIKNNVLQGLQNRKEISVAFVPKAGYTLSLLASSGVGRGVSCPLLASPGNYDSARRTRELTIEKRVVQ